MTIHKNKWTVGSHRASLDVGMKTNASVNRIFPRNYVGLLLGLCGDDSSAEEEKKFSAKVFRCHEMETTSSISSDLIGPPEYGEKVKEKNLLVVRDLRNDPWQICAKFRGSTSNNCVKVRLRGLKCATGNYLALVSKRVVASNLRRGY